MTSAILDGECANSFDYGRGRHFPRAETHRRHDGGLLPIRPLRRDKGQVRRETGGVPTETDEPTGAARALARGDPLRALSLASSRSDAAALLVRGIAYAQIGDFELSRTTLQRALSGPDPLVAARAAAARAEVLVEQGDLASALRVLPRTVARLERLGDARNAAMQRLVLARVEVLRGRLDVAERAIAAIVGDAPDRDVRAVAHLARAEIFVRRRAASRAEEALRDAKRVAERRHPLFERAIAGLESELARPVAKLERSGVSTGVSLLELEGISRPDVVLVDACSREVARGRRRLPLAKRPVLFGLVLALARAWPDEVARDVLVTTVFQARVPNDSHRARLRVEVGRLRRLLGPLGSIVAKARGYAFVSRRPVAILLPPSDDDCARLEILLGDGAAWSARALADHAGLKLRTAQRALVSLTEQGRVARMGAGRKIRYFCPREPIASRMLLLGLLPTS